MIKLLIVTLCIIALILWIFHEIKIAPNIEDNDEYEYLRRISGPKAEKEEDV